MVSAAMTVAIVTIVMMVIEFVLAGIILAAGPRRGTNRALAALIVFKAISVPPGVFGTLFPDRTLDYNATRTLWALAWGGLASYPIFLGYALETPLTNLLRRAWFRVAIILVAATAGIISFLFPQTVMTGPGRLVPEHGWAWDSGPLLTTGLFVYLFMVVFGLVAAISAFRRTVPGTMPRRRAKAYLLAFTTQDVGVAAALSYIFLKPNDLIGHDIANVVLQLAFGALVTTALLRYQLFDFDLKLKAAVARSALVAIFVGAFVLGSAIAQQYLQQYGILVGGAAVGALLIAIAPIRRASNALADRLFPGVSKTPDYLMRKKVEVYREALRDALGPDGKMDSKQSSALREFRNSLGLTQRDHDVMLAALEASPFANRAAQVVPGATILGKYRVERELGAGGSGKAFLASDVRMNRRVVLKTIPSDDQAAVIREARTAAAIEHPNVVRIYDVENVRDQTVLVMEYVDGGSLRERLRTSGPLSDSAFARIADDVLAALEAVHAAGAVHRDVKPSNILLTRDGRAKLADFGIAQLAGFETTIGGSGSGTAQYMSPEQARGKRLTVLSDLYSAAATMYEARTGRPVIERLPDESAIELRMRVGALRDFKGNVKPSKLRAWFARALAPEKRFSSAAEMRRALTAALH